MGMDRLLVGRDAECASLRAGLAAALAGPGFVILVTGEGGAGKTTLVEHVLACTSTPVLCGRAAEWTGTAYDVVARALRPAVRNAAGPVPGLLAQIMPELGAPPPEPEPAALAAAVCSVLAGIAGDKPLALFLDDLQWADEAALGFLPALADAASGLPVTVIGCYRSDELPRDHRLRAVRAQLRRSRQLTEIELGPLGDEDVRRMLASLLGATPQPTLTAVVASRADGIPFAVEELALALRDGGRLAFRDGTVALAGAGAAPVPDGIREAVLLRASRLAGEERKLLEAAAVAGQEFDIDTVLAICGMPAWPDGFTGAGLLTEVRDGRAGFRHSLTQEAAYADIPWSRRRGLHREFARTLAADGAAPALIAVHLLAARDFGFARAALIAAADAHCAVHAYRDAARALRTALEHWPVDQEDKARLSVVDRLARCAEMCSEYADAVTLLRELADGYERHGDLGALAGCQRRLALAHELRGQWEMALTAREAAAVAFSAAGLPAEAAIDRLAVATHLRAVGPDHHRVRGRAGIGGGAARPGGGGRPVRPGARDAGCGRLGPAAAAGKPADRHPDRARALGAAFFVGTVRPGGRRRRSCRCRGPGPADAGPSGANAGAALQRADPAMDGHFLRRARAACRHPRLCSRPGRDSGGHRAAGGHRGARPRAGRDLARG